IQAVSVQYAKNDYNNSGLKILYGLAHLGERVVYFEFLNSRDNRTHCEIMVMPPDFAPLIQENRASLEDENAMEAIYQAFRSDHMTADGKPPLIAYIRTRTAPGKVQDPDFIRLFGTGKTWTGLTEVNFTSGREEVANMKTLVR